MSKSLTITKESEKAALSCPPDGWNQTAATHPGEMLLEEFLKPMRLTINGLANQLDITPSRLHDLIRQRRGVTADTALRLAKFFKMSPHFWLNLQINYDLVEARKQQARREAGTKVGPAAGRTMGTVAPSARKLTKARTPQAYSRSRRHPEEV
jgi:addiction module HigA family antidote